MSTLDRIRAQSPLVHNVTNLVAMNWTANALLAAGALPVMAHAPEEIDEMCALSNALVVNVGTLDATWIESMRLAMTAAARARKPIVFDPVGAGATRFRTETCLRLLREQPPSVIRGNASEIAALAGATGTTRGVESALASESAITAARALARELDCVVCVSGATDYVVSSKRMTAIRNGHPMMAKVTAMGCAATALIGAAAAVDPDTFEAAIAGALLNAVAGEIAAEESRGPGSFQAAYLDALARIDATELSRRARLE